jgi:methanogenic corrinoid protein MtbC1
LQGSTVADLWDGPIARTLGYFGELWLTDESGIAFEHETTMAIMDAMARLKSLMPEPPAGAPKALGGSPSGDPYLLPNMAAAAVLKESGFIVHNLGPETPFVSFLAVAERHGPKLVWLSLTTKRTEKEAAQIDEFIGSLDGLVGQIVLGGRFALEDRTRWTRGARVLGTMNDLALVADTIRASR